MEPRLILAAGMVRSGSTWVYNALRLILSSCPEVRGDFSCGWWGEWKYVIPKRYMLMKIHEFDRKFIDKATLVVYSFRDIRDVMASSLRKFGYIQSIEDADYLVNLHEQWMSVADFVISYESILSQKREVIDALAGILGVYDIDPTKVERQIDSLSYEDPGPKNEFYHRINLYHKGHRTHGGTGSWTKCLDPMLVKEVEAKHQDWFKLYGYTISSSATSE